MRNTKWFARADWFLWTFIALLPIFVWLLRISLFPYQIYQPMEDVQYSYSATSSQLTEEFTTYLTPWDQLYGDIEDSIAMRTSLYKVLIDDFRLSGLHTGENANVVYRAIYDLAHNFFHVSANADNQGFLLYLSYFVWVSIFHLCVDVLLFIPRLAHNFMDAFTVDVE